MSVCRPPFFFFRRFLSHGDRMPCRATLPLTAVTDARTRFQHARPLKRRSSVRPGRGEKRRAECELAQPGGNVQGHARAHIKGPDGFKLWTHKHAPVSHRRLDCERKKKKRRRKKTCQLAAAEGNCDWNKKLKIH